MSRDAKQNLLDKWIMKDYLDPLEARTSNSESKKDVTQSTSGGNQLFKEPDRGND